MSDAYAIVAFSDIAGDACQSALNKAEAALRAAGLVDGDHDSEAILGSRANLVLRPGPTAFRDHCNTWHLKDLRTNGVAFCGPAYFNPWALVGSTWYSCPDCRKKIAAESGHFPQLLDDLGMAAANLLQDDGVTSVRCPECSSSSEVRAWRLEDPVFLADIALEFWNWPPFERGASVENRAEGATLWDIDVLSLIENAVEQTAMQSWVRI